MEGYFPVKTKRKDLDGVNDDFSDFSLSSPARKIRRLDAELPPIIEEEETVNPVVYAQLAPMNDTLVEEAGRGSRTALEGLTGGLPENEERAIVLFDPINNMHSLQSRQPFCITVNSDLLSRFKNPIIWSKGQSPHKSSEGETEKQDDGSEANNGYLAVVPWVPKRPQHQAAPEVEVPRTEALEMMDADDAEATTMDIEDNNYQQMPRNEYGSVTASEGLSQWQQHCMVPQPPHNMSNPLTWSGTGA